MFHLLLIELQNEKNYIIYVFLIRLSLNIFLLILLKIIKFIIYVKLAFLIKVGTHVIDNYIEQEFFDVYD
jgi:hypothetical protein